MAEVEPLGQNAKQDVQQAADRLKQGTATVQKEIMNLPNTAKETAQGAMQTTKTALTNYSGGISPDVAGYLSKVSSVSTVYKSFENSLTFRFQIHLWSAICLIGFTMGEMAGKNAFYGLTDSAFGMWASTMLFAVVTPLVV